MLMGPSFTIRQLSSLASLPMTGVTKSEYQDSMFIEELKLSLLLLVAGCILSASFIISMVFDDTESFVLGVSRLSLVSY